MSTVDRCECTLHTQDAGGGYTELGAEPNPNCPVHGDVDAILKSGRYTDRRGRAWSYLPLTQKWFYPVFDHQGISWPAEKTPTTQMRLLIERDQHRDGCEGLKRCEAHPVPFVNAYQMLKPVRFVAYRPNDFDDEIGTFHTLPEAMDAARALAVGE